MHSFADEPHDLGALTPNRPPRSDVARKPSCAALKSKLRNAGLSPTRQRLVLAAFIFDGGDRHMTAEMLYEQAVDANAQLSLGTVYNTLNQFAQAGLLRKVAIPEPRTWYDTNTGPHFHVYVEETGELFDIPPNRLSVYAPKMAPPGYEMIGVDLLVRGHTRTDAVGPEPAAPTADAQ